MPYPFIPARRILLFARLAILLGIALWSMAASGAASPWPEDETDEQRYWKRVHQQDSERARIEERQRDAEQERINASVPDLLRAGQAFQQELLVAKYGPPPPPPLPPWWQGRGDLITFGGIGVLVVVVVTFTLVRHKREAEIRALAGKYLADGTEAAHLKTPALFAVPTAQRTIADDDENADGDDIAVAAEAPNAMKERLAAFFAEVPAQLVDLLKTLQEASRTSDEASRHGTLLKMHTQVAGLKTRADCWELRPVWQMTSALEMLLKRLTEKPRDVTPSALRTVANALDVLSDLCVPGVRPDLVIHPPLSILAVDDDPFCRRGINFALQKVDIIPEMAADGERSVALCTEKYYDVIFMDIQMPGIDGLTACEQIKATKKNADTPVIFVTVQSDFATRAQSSLKGGAELMAKPFLVFEITVKALTFAMRKRLQLQQSLDRQILGPALLSEAPAATPVLFSAPPSALAPAETRSSPSMPLTDDLVTADNLDGNFFAKVPAFLAATRTMIQEAGTESDQAKRQERLKRIQSRLGTLGSVVKLSRLEFAGRINVALEALIKRLCQNPKAVTPSALNTISNALNVLESLCVWEVEQALAHRPAIKILVVEDAPLDRRAIVGALQLAFEKPDSANDGLEALKLVTEKPYDVIFSDIEMPELDGLGLCTKIREGGPNQNTPIVFITSHSDFESRARAKQSGGNDFIAKPFLPIEITVKALTFSMQKRLQLVESREAAEKPSEVETEETAVPA